MTAPIPHPLRFRDYRLYFMARLCATLAQNAMMIVLGWQAYSIARETMDIRAATAQLGLIGLAQFVPVFLLTPVSGWAADRFDRRHIGVVTIAISVACALALMAATISGTESLPMIFVLAVFLGIARCFNGPAMSSITPRLVPRESLPRAIAFSSIAWQSATIIGPALGGMIFAWVPWGSYALSAALFTLALLTLARIAPIPPVPLNSTRHPVGQMIDGLRYVRGNPLVLGAITLDLMAVLLAGATALLPVYARDILHVGATGLGQLAAAPGVGALLLAIWLGARPIENDVGTKMFLAVGVFGLATIAFGATAFMPHSIGMVVALGALFMCGAADMVSVFIRQSLIQIYTPDDMRGRVASVSMMSISASNELGETESGLLAALIGPVATVIAGGVGAIVVTLIWARLFPQLLLARRFDMTDIAPVTAATPAKRTETGS